MVVVPRQGRPSVAQTWTTVSLPYLDRRDHTTTVLDDGRLVMIGGHDLLDRPLGSVSVFDPVTGATTIVANLVTSRFDHAAIAIGADQILVVGGTSLGGDLGTGPGRLPRDGHTIAVADGVLFVMGGDGYPPASSVAAEHLPSAHAMPGASAHGHLACRRGRVRRDERPLPSGEPASRRS